jgi:hypothetical protein
MVSLSTMVRNIGKSLNVPPTPASKGFRRPAVGKPLQSLKKLALHDPANLRDENVPMLGVLARGMLERSDEARDF